MTAAGSTAMNCACPARQSRHFTWSANATPWTAKPAGIATSKG
jgi:hypothetical protein